jgi:hypothetical protein
MSAAAETLELAWKQANIEVLTVARTPANELDTGWVRGHTPKMFTSRNLTAYEIYQLLYDDDGAFPFPTRNALTKGLALIHSHFARFGLKVHIGRNSDLFKTECVFFPPPQFFDDIHLSDPALTDDAEVPWLLFQDTPLIPDTPQTTTVALSQPQRKKKKEKKETQEAACQRRIDTKYYALPEAQQIEVADGYVPFCLTCKYLGSHTSYNLRDDADIEAQLAAVNQSMGALNEVWRNPH